MVFSYMNWVTPSQAENATALISTLLNNVGPLIPLFGLVYTYINSRGKMKSNSIWATASMNNPLVQNKNLVGGVGDLLGSVFGGGGVKDPGTWGNVARTTGGILGGKAGETIGAVLGPRGGTPVEQLALQVRALEEDIRVDREEMSDMKQALERIERAVTGKRMRSFIGEGLGGAETQTDEDIWRDQ
jgi:hypothetical protein